MTSALPWLQRGWPGFRLPGFRDARGTYSPYPLTSLPPIGVALDDDLNWLRREPVVADSLLTSPYSPAPTRPLNPANLSTLWPDTGLLPRTFLAFANEACLRERLRSPTACYLDLGEVVVSGPGEGHMLHFLSDQQWVRHWLLYVDGSGREAVVSAAVPYGFPSARDEIWTADLSRFDPSDGSLVVCAESFSEFLGRLWIEGEIFFRVVGAREGEPPLSVLQRAYADQLTNAG